MKIQGPNQPNFNPYKNQIHKQSKDKTAIGKEDQLQISSQAQKMLEKNQPNTERAAHVDQIKEAVASGNYKVDFKSTASKMIDFWTKPQ